MSMMPQVTLKSYISEFIRLFILVLIAALFAAGCAPVNREKLIKDVIKIDPSFSAVLEKRAELVRRVETYNNELKLKRQSINEKIKHMRRELSKSAGSIKKKIEHTKKLMEPNQKRIDLSLSMTSEELKTARLKRASLKRSISKLRKALKSGNVSETPKQRDQQQVQLDQMISETSHLAQELVTLKERLRVLKLKRLLIKL